MNEEIKDYFSRKCRKCWNWFIDKEHPRSKLNKKAFFNDLLKIIGFILVFLIIYYNVEKLNQIVIIFIKIGSLLELTLLFFIVRKAIHLIKNLRYFFRGLNNGIKLIISILIILILVSAFVNHESVVESITKKYDNINFTKINPITVGNFSFFEKFSDGLTIECQADFNEDIRKAKVKDTDLRVKTIEKKSFEDLNEAIDYINSWDADNGDAAIKYIREHPQTQVNKIGLIVARFDFRECLFGECLEYSQLKFSVCDGDKAMHPKGGLFGDFFGGLFG